MDGNNLSNSGGAGPIPPQTASVIIEGGGVQQQQIVGEVALAFHSGPLPSPADLAAYAAIDPSLPRELLDMAKGQAAHIQRMQNLDMNRRIAAEAGARVERRIGQVLAFGVALMGIGSASYLAIHDHDWVAGVLGGSTVVALVGAFIAGRIVQQRATRAPARGEGIAPPPAGTSRGT
ncbi:MAG: hypothetical protein KIS87_07980 [Phycisphaeraceae bacterium]|nr:hypothetical protein [Phycisphaeraceae bacterium]